jgi:hypothetical protein
MDRDTFLTTVYVLTDDFCKSQQLDWRGRRGPRPRLSVAEVLTLALMSRWGRFRSESDFYAYAQRHWRGAFPGLPERSRFNRLVRTAGPWLAQLSHHLARQLQAPRAPYEALDTMGCATRNRQRRGNGWLAGEANIGYSNRLGWYEGLNVITATTPVGVITGFGCAPAATKEQPFAETFLAARAQQPAGLPEVGAPAAGEYLADNGFCGAKRHADWRALYGARVISPPQRTRGKHPWPKALRRWHARLRQIVETVHGALLSSFRLESERPHTLTGFRTRLAASCALHNLCIALNRHLGRPHLAFAALVEW